MPSFFIRFRIPVIAIVVGSAIVWYFYSTTIHDPKLIGHWVDKCQSEFNRGQVCQEGSAERIFYPDGTYKEFFVLPDASGFSTEGEWSTYGGVLTLRQFDENNSSKNKVSQILKIRYFSGLKKIATVDSRSWNFPTVLELELIDYRVYDSKGFTEVPTTSTSQKYEPMILLGRIEK